jgi:ribonuclease P/MRP protein subunit POP1
MSSAPAQTTGKKRKAVAITSADRKRQKTQNIRHIPVQSNDAAASVTGELDVAAFVKAREYEINALEKSMQRSKKGLTTRAFQQVPRALRRRTASHNVKKVPRRLRRRAEKEVSGVQEEETETALLDIEANHYLWRR